MGAQHNIKRPALKPPAAPPVTLRDRFAGQLAAALVGDPAWRQYVRGFGYGLGLGPTETDDRGLETTAHHAYRLADALLKARDR